MNFDHLNEINTSASLYCLRTQTLYIAGYICMHVWFIFCPCFWVIMRLTLGTLQMQQGQHWLMGIEWTNYDTSLSVWWGQTTSRFCVVGLCLPPTVQFPQADACPTHFNYEWNAIRNDVFLNESQCQNVIRERGRHHTWPQPFLICNPPAPLPMHGALPTWRKNTAEMTRTCTCTLKYSLATHMAENINTW